jgi:plastocyanin
MSPATTAARIVLPRWFGISWRALVAAVALAACRDQSGDADADARRRARIPSTPPRPAVGRIHTVRMQLDHEGYRFEPAYLDVRSGDGVRFVMISGIPHNVAFDRDFIPPGSVPQLAANLSLLGSRNLATPVVTTLDSAVVISTAGLPRGDYLFYCGPHRSLNMHGVIRVQ